MPIPKNITREHLIKAIEKIDNEGIPINGESQYYDVIYNGKIYPPKVIVSYSNLFANGEILSRNSFGGGEETECFKLLEKNNFIIKKKGKKDSEKKCWIEKTIVKGRPHRINGDRALGKALWSPKTGSDGRNTYKNMTLVKTGDLILHLVDNSEIIGISLVENEAKEVYGLAGTDWEGPCYLIKLKSFTVLKYPIKKSDILNDENKNRLNEISENSEVFYNSNMTLRQGGYLSPCPIELLSIINGYYKTNAKENLPFIDEFEMILENIVNTKKINQMEFDYKSFLQKTIESGLILQKKLITRFVSSLITKPFVILSGLSGSGKTKLAQAFAQWICQDDSQYCIIPVGADWTNREPLLGYPNSLMPNEYIKPDNGALQLLINANKHPEFPYFLILDEMNLSHVERYFADFLSVMESKGEICLFSEGTSKNGVPDKLSLPPNLFIIGTVNIDETTYMFSPKVLDRANAIEFRVTKNEIEHFFDHQKEVDMSQLRTQGASMAQSFLELAANKQFEDQDLKETYQTLINFFEQLKKAGAEFGYRSASEIIRLINQLTIIDNDLSNNEKLDIAIMQKLIPKLHGSRRKLCPILITLGNFCIEKTKIENLEKDVFAKEDFDFETDGVLYPISLEKITRMYNGAIENGFASYAEA